MKKPLLVFNQNGIYCPKAKIYIDAWRPVDKVIISHAHADHSKFGHQHYLTHPNSVPIVKHRLGNINIESKDWGEKFTINGVQFSLHPAGHIIGSSQVRVEYKGDVWVYSGDYKREDDGISTPFEPIKCNTFITECTFGLPAFNWRKQEIVINEINDYWKECKANNQTAVLFAYSLGKAQRLIVNLDSEIGKIYTHGAVENLNEVIRTYKNLPKTHRITRETKKEDLIGNLVIAPPSTHGSPWLKKMVPYVTSSSSGWMTFRGARRRRAIDRGFVLSDHVDWKDLIQTIEDTEAKNIVCTHGYKDIFSKYLNENGYNSFIENTPFQEEETIENNV
jgi:putative mRNA 3-end processing factor